eukprot:1453987-Lingulodinium_polyedra.AAC.1
MLEVAPAKGPIDLEQPRPRHDPKGRRGGAVDNVELQRGDDHGEHPGGLLRHDGLLRELADGPLEGPGQDA